MTLAERLKAAAGYRIDQQIGRLFWYTAEFGLVRQERAIKVYGSGVISSHRECANVIEGGCQIRDFELEEVLRNSRVG